MTAFTISNYLNAHQQLAQRLDTDAFQQGIEMIKAAFECGKKSLLVAMGEVHLLHLTTLPTGTKW